MANTTTLLGVYAAINSLAFYLLFVSLSSMFSTRFIMSPVIISYLLINLSKITMLASVLIESLCLYKHTLEIVLRSSSLDKDPLDDAFLLFTNLVNIFVTIVKELINKEERNNRRSRNHSD